MMDTENNQLDDKKDVIALRRCGNSSNKSAVMGITQQSKAEMNLVTSIPQRVKKA